MSTTPPFTSQQVREYADYHHHLDNWLINGDEQMKRFHSPNLDIHNLEWDVGSVREEIRLWPDSMKVALYKTVNLSGARTEFEGIFDMVMSMYHPVLVREAIIWSQALDRWMPLFESMPQLTKND